MANLFPENTNFEVIDLEAKDEQLEFKGSYLFDFEKGDFVRDANGSIIKCDDRQAFVQWCNKALKTPRFKYAYSSLYGQEFGELMNSGISTSAIELEIQRMITEALMVHPRTSKVKEFSFKWSDNKQEVFYEFEVTTIDEESIIFNDILELR